MRGSGGANLLRHVNNDHDLATNAYVGGKNAYVAQNTIHQGGADDHRKPLSPSANDFKFSESPCGCVHYESPDIVMNFQCDKHFNA